MTKHNRESGITLLEILIVFALIAVIVLVSIPTFLDVVNSYRVSTSASELALRLRFARNAAIKKKQTVTVSLNDASASTDPNTYTLSTDNTITNQPIVYLLNQGVQIKSGSPTVVTFKSNGSAATTPTSSTTITLVDPRGNDSYKITIIASGALQTEKLL